MNDVIRGVIGGLAGTVAMSAAMVATRVTGAMRRQVPPREIAANAEDAIGLLDHLSVPEFEASWKAQHLAYGMAAGVAYALIRRKIPLPAPVAGPAFGAALWAFGYAGWLPALGLYPPPTEDTSDRIASMIVHHLIYGTVTAMTADALRDDGPA